MSNISKSGQQPITQNVNQSVPTAPPVKKKIETSSPLQKKTAWKQGETLQGPRKLASQTELAQTHQKIDNIPHNTLVENAKKSPQPTPLQQAISNLKSVESTEINDRSAPNLGLALNESIGDTATAKKSTVVTKDVNSVHQSMSDQQFSQSLGTFNTTELKSDNTNYVTSLANTERNLPTQLKNSFADVYKQYDKKTSSLIGSKTSKSGETAVKQAVSQWISNQGEGSDLVQLLKTKSPGDRKQFARQLLQDLKGYDNTKMSKLSPRKEAFIQAVLDGINTGVNSAPNSQPGPIKNSLNNMNQKIKNLVQQQGGQDSQLGRELLLRSDQSVLEGLNSSMGNQSQQVLNAMLSGINEGLGSQVSDNTVSPRGKDDLQVPETLTIDGKTYAQPKYLAEGGFANIIAYTNPNDENDQVVLKQLKSDNSKSIQEFRAEASEELLNQIELEGTGGHPNLNKLTTAIRGKNDQLYIVQDMAKGGDLNGVNKNLRALSESNVLPQSVKNLLGTHLLKGILQGMDHIQNERQAHHFDLKLPNVLLGNDGQAKITDFGLSGLGDTRSVDKLTDNQNPIYQSPELVSREEDKKNFIDNYLTQQGVETFESLYPRRPTAPKDTEDLDAMLKYATKVTEYVKNNEYVEKYQTALDNGIGKNETAVSNRADTWNVGILAYELLQGDINQQDMYAENFMSKIARNVENFSDDHDNRLTPSSTDSSGEMAMGSTAVGRLINGLSHPDLAQRTNLKDALDNSIFKEETLDNPVIGQLLLKISQVDPSNLSDQDKTDIQQMVQQLQN